MVKTNCKYCSYMPNTEVLYYQCGYCMQLEKESRSGFKRVLDKLIYFFKRK